MAAPKQWVPSAGVPPVDINTGLHSYDDYLNTRNMEGKRKLRTCGGTSVYVDEGNRKFPWNADPIMLRVHPDITKGRVSSVLTEETLLYLLEGQMAFMEEVMKYEREANRSYFSSMAKWKCGIIKYFLGCCTGEELNEWTRQIASLKQLQYDHQSWVVRYSKTLSAVARHGDSRKMGKLLEIPIGELVCAKANPYRMEPRTFLSLILSSSKGRFCLYFAPSKCAYDSLRDFDFEVCIAAIQGHSRVPDHVSAEAMGHQLTIEECRNLGFIFHASKYDNYNSILERGLLLEATRYAGQRARTAIHFVYAGGSEGPREGTVIRYGRDIFYAQLNYEEWYINGHVLYLTTNGVVLSYEPVESRYLSHHYRPPHEKDPGGERWNRRQAEEGGSVFTEVPSEAASSSAAPKQEVRSKKMPKKKPAEGSSVLTEVPTFNKEEIKKLIIEAELEEARKAETTQAGTSRPYERGEEVHGRVNVERHRAEELNTVLRQASTNPWFLYKQGVLKLRDAEGGILTTNYGDGLARVTRWATLPAALRESMGSDFGIVQWLRHPLSGYGIHLFLKAFELGKLQGNYLLEMNEKPNTYTRPNRDGVLVTGYVSPYEKTAERTGGATLVDYLEAINDVQNSQFLDREHAGYLPPRQNDPRQHKPKADDPDFEAKMEAHDMWKTEVATTRELQYLREDFSLLISCVCEAYGKDFFFYMRQNKDNHDLREKYKITSFEGHELFDSTLREKFNGAYLIRKLEQRFSSQSQKSFNSETAKKAFADLIEYEAIRAKHEADLEELCSRPFDDIAVEEFLAEAPPVKVEEIIEEDVNMEDVKPKHVTGEFNSAATGSSVPTEEPAPMNIEPEVSPMETGDAEGSSVFTEVPEVPASKEPVDKKPRVEKSMMEEGSSVLTEEPSDVKAEPSPEREGEPGLSSAEDLYRAARDQGIWGQKDTYIDREAFSAYVDAQFSAENEEAFDELLFKTEIPSLRATAAFRNFVANQKHRELVSPLMDLTFQKHGPNNGFYHDNIRTDTDEDAFKFSHMIYRVHCGSHPHAKYELAENELVGAMARLPPIYERRARRDDIVFKAGDVRSLCDADVLERATKIKEEVEHIQDVLLEKLKELKDLNTPATREQLMKALLNYFLSCGFSSRSDFGNLKIEAEEFSNYRPREYDHETDEVVLYTSRTSMTCLCANLGNFVRSRKQTLPKAYADLLESRWENHVGPLVHSLGRAKAHVLMLCEASTLEADDLAFLEGCGWTYIRNAAEDLLMAIRTNNVGGYIRQIAGSNLAAEEHSFLPISYMIVEANFGKTASIGQAGKRTDFDDSELTQDLRRSGLTTVRLCVFHLKSSIAKKKVAATHEALGTMLMDCMKYQVDILSGDANMAAFRYQGSKQGSISIAESAWQSMVDYFIDASFEATNKNLYVSPRVHHFTANPVHLLKLYEDILGQPYSQVSKNISWDSLPGLDCMVGSVFEWGHSYPDSIWKSKSDHSHEYKVTVSEWTLNSNKTHYLLPDGDNDSHTPLFFDISAAWMANQTKKEMERNPDTLLEKARRRQERQMENRMRGKGPEEPQPPKGKGKQKKGKDKGAKGKGKKK